MIFLKLIITIFFTFYHPPFAQPHVPDYERAVLPPASVTIDVDAMCDEAVVADDVDRTEHVSELAWLFHRSDLFGEDWWKALMIVDRESGCRQTAISPTRDYGLFQINKKVWGTSWARDVCDIGREFFDERWKVPEENARAARCIRERQGWRAWVVCKWAWCRR